MKRKVFPVTHYQQNCSLIWCEQTHKAALIDPGGDISVLLSAVEENGLELEKILLTHGHMDHVGGVPDLVAKLQIPVEGPHADDAFWLNALEDQARMMGFPPKPAFIPSRWLNDGDLVTVGHGVLKVISCPGHTPGHVVFYSELDRLAWVGDVLFKGSVGRTDFPKGNREHLIASITQKLWPLGDDVTFIPGHGPLSTFGFERRHNPFVADKNFG